MSTKRIFDDMYLYLKEANSQLDKDTLNGMPANTYEELTSYYWNLIYKNSQSEHQHLVANSANFNSIEKEFHSIDKIKDFNFDFGIKTLDNFLEPRLDHPVITHPTPPVMTRRNNTSSRYPRLSIGHSDRNSVFGKRSIAESPLGKHKSNMREHNRAESTEDFDNTQVSVNGSKYEYKKAILDVFSPQNKAPKTSHNVQRMKNNNLKKEKAVGSNQNQWMEESILSGDRFNTLVTSINNNHLNPKASRMASNRGQRTVTPQLHAIHMPQLQYLK